MKFVILHGSFGSPEGNWFPQLRESLENIGQEVIIPQFPVDNWDELLDNPSQIETKQNLRDWLAVFEKEVVVKIDSGEKVCVVAHSMGPLFLLHTLEKYNINIDTTIFVAPFFELESNPELEPIDRVAKTFYQTKFNFELLKKKLGHSYVLYSENDMYVSSNQSKLFAKKLESSLIFVRQGGHMNSEVNLNEFPLVLELCKTSLDYNLYSRFIDYKSKCGIDYIRGHKEGFFSYDPELVPLEGTFHFRNLQKKGFCTFIVGTGFWEEQSTYMEEGRKAARRVGGNMTRIFLLKTKDDLKNKSFRRQLEGDLTAGMKIGLIEYDTVLSIVETPDFGIWDDSYVCVVPFEFGKVEKIRMSSRKEDMNKYKNIADKIMAKAHFINSMDDVNNYIF